MYFVLFRFVLFVVLNLKFKFLILNQAAIQFFLKVFKECLISFDLLELLKV